MMMMMILNTMIAITVISSNVSRNVTLGPQENPRTLGYSLM